MHIQPDPYENVGKLLGFKRHEQPPPRYFQDFADRVMARIEAAEARRSLSWWQRLGLDWNLKPAFVCAFGVILSAGLLAGMLVSVNLGQTTVAANQPGLPVGEDIFDSFAVRASNLNPIEGPGQNHTCTEPVPSSTPSSWPFSHLQLSAQRVSWNY